MAEHIVKKWIFNNSDVENRIINGLAFSEIDEFHFDVERENQTSTYGKKPISIEIVGENEKVYTVSDVRTCEHKTLIHASYNGHNISFIVPTKDILSQLTDN